MTTITHLPLLLFFTLTLSIHAKIHLNTGDHHALLTILKHLGVFGDLRPPENPCSITGISCERRTLNGSDTLRVTRIVFETRRLTGFLSPAIGQLSKLKELSLNDNYLNDRIPPELGNCRKIEIINFGNNKFSGEVPAEVSYLLRLRILDLSSNEFTGELGFLKHFPNLEKLALENNMFTGKVPVSLRLFRNLRLFNISGNSLLEGELPELNRLESPVIESKKSKYKRVPKRYVFAESTNPNGNNDSGPGKTEAPAPAPVEAPSKKHKKRNRKKIMGWVLGFFAGSFAGILSIIIFSVLIKLFLIAVKYGGNQSGPTIFSPSIKAEELKFLEDDNEVAALQVIGRGGCGLVYKTDIPNEKIKTIAIKMIIQPPKDAGELTAEDTKMLNKKMRQIRSEIQTVGQIRHRNLLALLAHVSRPTCHYLVYEFMKNGSLQDILEQVKSGTRELEWLVRHNIAIGVASGLEYLHMSHTPRIVHRDLKPANILLDDDMEARIADFGLAKSIPGGDTHMTSSNVAGTLGYIAPEYHQTLKFTDKCDIYSFGVLLGVLVMGKLPSDEFFQHTSEVNLVKWMRKVMTSDNPKEAIDQSLLGNGYETQMLLVLKIACFCTLDDPKERPNSKDCRCMLAQIEH
ncbi:putative transferase, protein kinase RLK-Pelle-LRR-XI-2 family [Helianthus annuus]|uniref:Putative death-associated protein kinase 1, Leucine-rich repeat domain, L domain-like protein n=1 Tax=Helianthus annuus TaxID=4232 RepID=A0A251UWV0_HELAN|nr:leucine-rich repeat receptor-like serine/threonine/tyrosine-protein kinase SOBIR1 [Helianthus annuus]KAF5808689.1 putative transferase, protein kinase RLK-Pelle-LRR-XI-2 family [Helianthus annuus]KAJ0579795.1 putative transferase, protein kinase RLK-Pelle-LRR-XI-2 family [Helianthus annuus]KAJ0587110.1 putative transferase, protein kinase RLK-Pelle-LRR-XI-2 family [Helianthus annuus]KAJ0595714.1 putative transferase, protein kinase RLK-Pelle-LRR-XI-2 family [Helianthus annuus]KAJ0756363.1 p